MNDFHKHLRKPANYENNLTESEEKKLIHFVVGYFLVQIVNASLKNIFIFSEGMNSMFSVLAATVIVVLFLRCARYLIFNKFGYFFFLEVFFFILYLLGLLSGLVPQDISLIEKASYTLGICIPISIAFLVLSDNQNFLEAFRRVSYLIIVIGSSVLVIAATAGLAHGGTYNMSIAGMMLPCILLLIVSLANNYSIRDLLFVIVGTTSIFMGASRWPLISILTCIVLCVILFGKKRRALIILSIAAVLLLLGFFWNEIISCINSVFTSLGISSRNLSILTEGSFLTSTSQRTDVLFPYYINLIFEKPILGWGLFGGWIQDGLGPHNMLLEIMLAFGVPLGLLISIAAVILPLIAIRRNRDAISCIWLVVFYCMVFPMFFVEGNFITTTAVFCLYLLAAVLLVTMKTDQKLRMRLSRLATQRNVDYNCSK